MQITRILKINKKTNQHVTNVSEYARIKLELALTLLLIDSPHSSITGLNICPKNANPQTQNVTITNVNVSTTFSNCI